MSGPARVVQRGESKPGKTYNPGDIVYCTVLDETFPWHMRFQSAG